ncbi:hypothetical protein [Streptomyces sp. NPDC057280]|uniref:hypothetical protein n=1 Tax=Streptomyces sp. NPDC057280 TaxID=3346081 RepID=UPI003627B772
MTLAAVAAVLAGLAVAPQAAAAAPPQKTPAAASCTTQWEVTGKRVAVRRPASGSVASPNSPVDHYLHKGDRVTSCVAAIARTESGPAYHKCGRDGHLWQVVRGGQVPQTCLKKVR